MSNPSAARSIFSIAAEQSACILVASDLAETNTTVGALCITLTPDSAIASRNSSPELDNILSTESFISARVSLF